MTNKQKAFEQEGFGFSSFLAEKESKITKKNNYKKIFLIDRFL